MAVTHLACRECGAEYDLTAQYVCTRCFGPLEAKYDHSALAEIKPDGAFRIERLLPDIYGLELGGLENGCFVKAVNDKPHADPALRFAPALWHNLAPGCARRQALHPRSNRSLAPAAPTLDRCVRPNGGK